jgi:hypothetical protein
MVPKESSAGADADHPDFRLIDLSRFSSDTVLARDSAHMLLCHVATHLPDLNDRARQELADLILDPAGACEQLPRALEEGVALLAEAPSAWMRERQILPDWQPQHLLALQACALMFVGRAGVTEVDRHWFFNLAALACEAYLLRGSSNAAQPASPDSGSAPRRQEPHHPLAPDLASLWAEISPQIRRRLADTGGQIPIRSLRHGVTVIAHRCASLRACARRCSTAASGDAWQSAEIERLAGDVLEAATTLRGSLDSKHRSRSSAPDLAGLTRYAKALENLVRHMDLYGGMPADQAHSEILREQA